MLGRRHLGPAAALLEGPSQADLHAPPAWSDACIAPTAAESGILNPLSHRVARALGTAQTT